MNLKFAISSALVLFAALPAVANRESGGGDPLASEFIRVARGISDVLPLHPARGEINKLQFDLAVQRVSLSLGGINPLVVFPDGNTVTCFSAPKIGCVPGDGKIHIARQGWSAGSLKDKIEVTAMELSLLAGNGQNRYEFAPDLAVQVLGSGFSLQSTLTPEYVSESIQIRASSNAGAPTRLNTEPNTRLDTTQIVPLKSGMSPMDSDSAVRAILNLGLTLTCTYEVNDSNRLSNSYSYNFPLDYAVSAAYRDSLAPKLRLDEILAPNGIRVTEISMDPSRKQIRIVQIVDYVKTGGWQEM